MTKITKNIIKQEIGTVLYSEVNLHDGKFYFDGFDTFDHSINVQMKNGFWWHLAWKDNEYFEFGEGLFERNKHLKATEIKSWEATERWIKVINSKIIDFKIIHIDEACFIPFQIKINFENGKTITILIAEQLKLNETLPYPLAYDFSGKIYIFHDENLIKTTTK